MEENSLRDTITIKCQQCGEQYDFNVCNVINLQKDQDLYEPLFSLDLFKHQCEKCGYLNVVQYDMMVVDNFKKYMIFLFGPERMSLFKESVDRYIKSLEQSNSQEFQVLKENIQHTRVVNSINDLKEKLLIFDYDLNDKIIELIKRGLYTNKLIDQKEFPYILFNAIDQDKLAFVCIGGTDNTITKEIGISIKFYNKILDSLGDKIKESKELDFPLIDKNWAINLTERVEQK